MKDYMLTEYPKGVFIGLGHLPNWIFNFDSLSPNPLEVMTDPSGRFSEIGSQ